VAFASRCCASRSGLDDRDEKEIFVNVLVTGGAGFIGSNLVRSLLDSGHAVRVLDDQSTGRAVNLEEVEGQIEFVTGDLRDLETVRRAGDGVDTTFHLGAIPSVARSVAEPLASHAVNVDGTINVLTAARELGVRRVVFASSSAVYGNTPTLPKHEGMPVGPLSPYAASKLAGEGYCRAYANVFGVETVALRFFNVFGPRQNPASEYASVIPRFVNRMLSGERPGIFGDGLQTRDFTYVENVVRACELAAAAGPDAVGQVVNVGCGARTSLLDLVATLNEVLGTSIEPEFHEPRPGDVRDSEASIERATALIGYRPTVSMHEGLERTVAWFDEKRTPAVPG
jgi:UDP-glucose 4-epimerase